MTFGAVLREARERKGLDVATAARELRIRADILRAIENNDFSRMPPRGYTRNMVNAYARLVGLNPSEITRMYLDEANAYQTGRMRNEATRTRPARERRPAPESAQRTQRRTPREESERRDRASAANAGRRPAQGRALLDDRTTDRVHPSRHTIVPGSTQYTNLYAAPQNVPRPRSKMPLIIGAAVVVLIIVIVCALVFGNKSSQPAQETPTVPITGLSDTSNKQADSAEGSASSSSDADASSSSTSANATQTATAPTKATFAYKVASGGSVYIEVYEGDSSTATVAQTVSGPTEKSFDVTTKLRFISDASSSVTCTLDGEKVELSENSNGMYDYTVDFSQILSKWQSEHGSASSSAGTQSSSTSGTASSSSSTQSTTSKSTN